MCFEAVPTAVRAPQPSGEELADCVPFTQEGMVESLQLAAIG